MLLIKSTIFFLLFFVASVQPIGYFNSGNGLSNDEIEKQYSLVQNSSYASCFVYEIHDLNGNVLDLPDEIKNALDCPMILEMDQRGEFLIYEVDNTIFAYNFFRKEKIPIYSLPEDLDGVSSIAWNPSYTKFAFVMINQELFPETTKIVVIDWDKDKLKSKINNFELNKFDGEVFPKSIFDKKIRFSCGSICTSVVGEDFWFLDNDMIKYVTYIETPYEKSTKVKQFKLVITKLNNL